MNSKYGTAWVSDIEIFMSKQFFNSLSMGLAKEGKVENERLCVIQHPTSIPAQYFQPYSHRCIKGIGGVQPGARCIWTSSHRCLGRPDFFFGNWALVQTGANIIFGSACERLQNMIQWKWVGLLCVLRHFKGVLGVDVPARLSFSYSFVFVLFKQIHIEVLKAAIGCLVLGGRGSTL